MTNSDSEMCIDYRYLSTYGMDTRIALAYDTAPLQKRAILNRLEHLYHAVDEEGFVREAMSIQDSIAGTGLVFPHIAREEVLDNIIGVLGLLEGYALQMVMGKEESQDILFPGTGYRSRTDGVEQS